MEADTVKILLAFLGGLGIGSGISYFMLSRRKKMTIIYAPNLQLNPASPVVIDMAVDRARWVVK
ncbi:MAG: hypothetical protein ACP5IE_00135 [Infirmifilum sp.]